MANLPDLSTEQAILDLLDKGLFKVLEEQLAQILTRHPNWFFGWNTLCTLLQILGKDYEDALQRVLPLTPCYGDEKSVRRKIFCIGANKTGTTSVEGVFKYLGLAVGNQAQAELLLHDWGRRDFRRIIGYCHTAEAFQDVPFSFQDTFRILDEAFPGSKFILTIRNNADEWFDSLVRFHTLIAGKGRIPTAEDLRHFHYRYPGFLLDSLKLKYGIDESRLYDREIYVRWYEAHNGGIREHFKGRPNDLLVLNTGEEDAMERLMSFLGYPYRGEKMPHLNSSRG